MKSKFIIEVKKGIQFLKTVAGTILFEGKPRIVETKFGTYLVFPRSHKGGEKLVEVKARHRVFSEFKVKDGSGATVYRQVRNTPDGKLKKGDWHVNASDVAFA